MLSLSSGLVAGAGHVLTGPDHLAALAPVATRQPGAGFKLGVIWGMGHGMGVLILAIAGYFLGSTLGFETLSGVAEIVVGLSLILLGIWSFYRAKGMAIHAHPHEHGEHRHQHDDQHEHLHVHENLDDHEHADAHRRHSHATMAIGFLHGIAGAGHFFAAVPAFFLSGMQSFVYLGAYLFSAVLAMGSFGLFLGRFLVNKQPSSLRPYVMMASGLTISIGVFWTANSLV